MPEAIGLQEGKVWFGSQFKRGQSVVGPSCYFEIVVSGRWGEQLLTNGGQEGKRDG